MSDYYGIRDELFKIIAEKTEKFTSGELKDFVTDFVLEFGENVGCEVCGDTVDLDDYIYCSGCFSELENRCAELEDEISDIDDRLGDNDLYVAELEDEIELLKEELEDLKKEK